MNKVFLVGNIGQQPEVRGLPNGGQVANFSLATSKKWRDKVSGEQREKTEWHKLVAFQGTASIVAQLCQKGTKVAIEGELQTRKWQDQQGQDQYTTEVVVNEIEVLSAKPQGQQPQPQRGQGQQPQQGHSQQGGWGQQPQNQPQQAHGQQGHSQQGGWGQPQQPHQGQANQANPNFI